MGKRLSPLELELISNLDNFSFHELSEAEKNAIHNKEDYPIISIIYGLSDKDLNLICNSIFVDSRDMHLFHEYLCEEQPWINDFKYYYCKDRGEDVSSTAGFCESLNSMCKTYCLYFAAKHPSEIKILKELKIKEGDNIKKIDNKEGYKKTNIFLSLAKEEIRLAKEKELPN